MKTENISTESIVSHIEDIFRAEKEDIGIENTYFWDIKTE